MTILSETMAGSLSASFFRKDSAGSGDGAVIAPVDGKAYVSGDRSVPLRRATIPQVFAETISRFGPRDAAVFRQFGKRYTYYDLDREVDALPPAAGARLNLATGSDMGAEPAGMADHAVRHGADRPRDGQHQPGLSRLELEYASTRSAARR